jgi:hypothetical protein
VEKEKTAFAVEQIPVAEEFSMNFHFTDGVEYGVSAIGHTPGSEPLRTEQILLATAVGRPRAMFPALVLFLIVIASGLMAGPWSCRKRTPSQP